MGRLAGKTALITGGTRGIGRAIAFRLAQEGCAVAVNYLNAHDAAESLQDELRGMGCKVVTIQAHVGDESSRQDLWTAFDAEFKQLDYLIANAATGVFRPVTTLSLNSLRKVMAVNYEGFLSLSKDAVARMPTTEKPAAGEKGRIIALSSIGAERALPNYGSIGASKAAMEAMARQLAAELGGTGVNVNTVRAGLVDTGVLNFIAEKSQVIADAIARTPNGRLVEPSEVADLVLFLLTSQAAMINGQTITVDGGYSILP